MSKRSSKKDKVAELTADLQRLRADFENYRKRVEIEKSQTVDTVKAATVMKLLPIVDDIDRSLSHLPEDLQDNDWAKGVVGLKAKIEKQLSDLGVSRIDVKPGTEFDPELHEAMLAEEGEGDQEVVRQELMAGYKLNGTVIRHSKVKVSYT